MKRVGLALAITAAISLASPGFSFAEHQGKDEFKKANGFKVNSDKREGALDSYVNPDTDDSAAQLKLLLQETYVTQQRAILNQFALTYGDHIRLQPVLYKSGDLLVPGEVFTPKDRQPGKRYPLVVLLHGGFHERLDYPFFPLIDTMIKAGYVVIFPEYRGSRGQGPDYYDNDYGVSDTADVLAAAHYMATKDWVDGSRMGIVGESRGGMVTLLAIEHEPKLFKGAVDIVGLTDFVAYMAYKPDYRRHEVAAESKSFDNELPDKNLPAYMKVSPINYVEQIETPLLVMATTGDKIAPLSLHSGRLIDVLKAHGKLFESKIYDNAPGGHVFMHGDTPERADATMRLMAWLDRYVKGAAQ